jgi:hypothetical protein
MMHPEAGDDLGKQRSQVYASEPFFRSCGVSRTAIPACPMAPGHVSGPCCVVTATHANKIAAPTLKTKRPSKQLGRRPALAGRKAMPSAMSAIPAKRAIDMPMPSGLAPKSSMPGTSGARRKSAPVRPRRFQAKPPRLRRISAGHFFSFWQ